MKTSKYMKYLFRAHSPVGRQSQALERLPDDIILSIFCHVSYWDMKASIPLVCRRFHGLIKNPQVERDWQDKVPLFQNVADICVTQSTPESIRLHPAFQRIYYCGGGISDVLLAMRPGVHIPAFPSKRKQSGADADPYIYLRLTNSPIAHENAVSPAMGSLVISPPGTESSWRFKVTPAEPGVAVTVLDIMKALVKFYSTEWEDPLLMVRCTHGKSLEVKGKKWRFGTDLVEGNVCWG